MQRRIVINDLMNLENCVPNPDTDDEQDTQAEIFDRVAPTAASASVIDQKMTLQVDEH